MLLCIGVSSKGLCFSFVSCDFLFVRSVLIGYMIPAEVNSYMNNIINDQRSVKENRNEEKAQTTVF